MKILFLFFLLLNAAYFYYQAELSEAPESSSILSQPPLAPGVERLTLLRERGLGGAASKPVVSQNTASQSEAPAPRVDADSTQTKSSTTASVSTPSVAIQSKPIPEGQAAKSKEAACFTLGPFTSASTASRTAQSISALGVLVERRQETQRSPKGYWVYLPASASYQAAKRKVVELQKKGLTDLFIMGKGGHKNAISLGLFKSKDVAEDRFQQIKNLGLKAVFETQYRLSQQAWLDMTVSGDQTATVATMTEIADGIEQAELTQRKCQ